MRTRNIEKEQLVKEKTVELIVKDGFEGFSINKLAKMCGISVATLYIYYKSKNDLLIQVATEYLTRWNSLMLDGLNPNLPFESGMRLLWRNRVRFYRESPEGLQFFEQMRNSSYQLEVFAPMMKDFKTTMSKFLKNAQKNDELVDTLTPEIFFTMAFAPLHNLFRFDYVGKGLGGTPFKLTDKIIWRTFDLVMRALNNK
ncbi:MULTISPECIES: TetR/AcrR family transcriptional regulator [Chitinophagaceae]